MGKRSNFERRERDYWQTPAEAVAPLLPHLSPKTRFCEPCAGDGTLVNHLRVAGHVCASAFDIEPQADWIDKQDARTRLVGNIDCFITNPPWTRKVLHPLIVHLCFQHPTWLLFDADWMHTQQSKPYLPFLRMIVSVGRVKWIPDSDATGKDNCAWHLFDARLQTATVFYGRAA